MTDNHIELCERLIADIGAAILGEGTESVAVVLSRCADLIRQQAARTQQQAARIAELEKERDALKAAEAAAIERCAKFMEARADEIAAADNCTANIMAMIYRDEAKFLRALLPKEEG